VAARRVVVLRMFLVALLALIAIRLVDLQVVRSGQYQASAHDELVRTVTIPALRGGIYDRAGHVLSLSVPTKQVVADDFQITHPALEALALSPLIGVDAAHLEAMLSRRGPGSGDVTLASAVPLATATTITADAFPGITVLDSSYRSDPNGDLARSLLGFDNFAGAGASGLEYQYNTLLAGRAGMNQVLVSPNGLTLPQSAPVHLVTPIPGRGLELTLDLPLQYQAEQALGRQILATNSISGTAIVMDTRTGDVLAQANLVNTTLGANTSGLAVPLSVPSSHPIVPGTAEAMNDLALTATYEPGSVFKLVPFSAALEARLITPATVFNIPNQISFDGYTFHDAENHGQITLTSTGVLAQSSNLGTFQIASKVGEQGLLTQVAKLGFGQPTGLGVPGESPGLLVNSSSWSPTDLISLAIGQVDSATPQQVLDAYNAVANGGVFVAPRLVRAVVNADGSMEATPASTTRRVLSYPVAAELNAMLKEVVLDGTGTNAVVPGYSVAGKTGTAQIPAAGGANYVPGAYNATFVGYAPAENPVLTTIVVLNRPTPAYFGGVVAAPVFSSIMSYALHRYGIPTTKGAPTQITSTGQVVGDVTGAGVVR